MTGSKRLATLLVSSCAAMALASCGLPAVGPNFTRPDAPAVERYTAQPLPDQTVSADIAGGASQKFLDGQDIPAEWWTLFQSPELNALVAEALKNNATLEAAQAALRQAEANAAASTGSLFPSVKASGTATRKGPGINTSPSSVSASTNTNVSPTIAAGLPGSGYYTPYNLYNASIGVSYVFDFFGGVRRNVEAQHAVAENQQFLTEAAYLTLVSNVLTAAIQYASLNAQIAATEDIVKAQTDSLNLLNQQFEFGAVSKGDVLAQQSQLAATQAQLPLLQKQAVTVQNQLAVLLGRLPVQSDFAKIDLATLHLPQELPVTVPTKLVEQRPDVRASEASFHQASANLGVATANLLPQFTISAAYGSSGVGVPDLSNIANSGNLAWSLAGGITQPIFQGGTLINQRRAASAGLDKAAATYRGTVLSAFADVANVLNALQLDADGLKAQLYAEQSAEQSLAITQERLRAGAISYLDLLNAERTYQQARIALVQAQATRYADTVALFQALGGGWWNRTDDQKDMAMNSADGRSDQPIYQPATVAATNEANKTP